MEKGRSSQTDHPPVIDLSKRGRVVPTAAPRGPPSIPTKFPTIETLGIYCDITGRVFNMNSARENGILETLLKPVGRYFGSDARTKYLEQCSTKYAKNSFLGDVDVMMIGKIKKFYNNGLAVTGRGVGRRSIPKRDNTQEASTNSTKYRTLFNAASSIELARSKASIQIE